MSTEGWTVTKRSMGESDTYLTDVLGRIYGVHLHAANRHDSPQGVHLLRGLKDKISTLEKVLADKTYRGTFAEATRALGLEFEVPERAEEQVGLVVEKKRWVVERSFAWMNSYRRVAMDWEHTVQSSAAFILLANISMVIEKIGDCGQIKFPNML